MKTIKLCTAVGLAVSLTFASAEAREASPAGKKVDFAIDAPSIVEALLQFTQQSGLQLVIPTSNATEAPARRVFGSYTPAAALDQLLAGTAFRYEFANPRTVAIRTAAVAIDSKSANNEAAVVGPLWESADAASGESPSAGGGESAQNAEASKGIPQIFVRGSRVLNTDIERTRDDSQPYIIFNREMIEKSGATSVEGFLRDNLTSMSAETTQSQGRSNGAFSTLSLRGLGSDQTLILIDGRRTASVPLGGDGFQADINGIPTSAIERIDVLPSTAAGIYGGGATGGVINIILKRDYTGVEATVRHEDTVSGGGGGDRIDLSGGFSFAGGRASLSFSGSYLDNDELLVSNRDLVQRAQQHLLANNPSAIYDSPTPPLGRTSNIRSAPGFDPITFAPIDPQPLTLKDGTLLNSFYTNVPAGYAGPSADGGAAFLANAGKYNLNFADTAQTGGGLRQSLLNNPIIKSATATLRGRFTDHVQGFLEFNASENSGRFNVNNQSGTFLVSAFAPDNPFNQDVYVTTPVGGADMQSEVSLKGRRAGGGLIVQLTPEWQASADYTWNSNDYFSSTPNQSLNPDSFSAVNDGTLNFFKAAPVDVLGYLLPNVVSGPATSKLESTVARVAGPITSLPGGKIRLSSALEYRRESLDDFNQDFPFAGGEYIQTNFSRDRVVDSIYTEFFVPVFSSLNAVSGVQSLELTVSGRWDRYKTNSSNSSNSLSPTDRESAKSSFSSVDPLIALRWQITRDVALRASGGTGFKPPALSDLAPGASVTYTPDVLAFAGLTDPKRGNEPLGATGSSVLVLYGGNSDLKPEDSRSFSAGVILTPRTVPGFRFSLDWTRTHKTNNIGQMLLQQDSLAYENNVPGFIVRAAPLNDGYPVGPIISFNSRSLNFANQTVEAFDVALDYRLETGGWGAFAFGLAGTRNTEGEQQVVPGIAPTDYLGVQGFSKYRANGTISWNRGPWRASWIAHYHDNYWVSVNHQIAPNQGSATVPSQVLHDAQLGYEFQTTHGALSFLSNSDLRLGMRNVFNKRPPVDLTNPIVPYSVSGDPRMGTYWISFRKSFNK
ncbi:MAG: TonB-dependent receptor [Gammaproteobacteria bacterium]